MNTITVRNYNPSTDYEGVKSLYIDSSTYGGQYDDARDLPEKLKQLTDKSADKILVAEIEQQIVGTLTLFEDGRAAWLYRFAVQHQFEKEIAEALYNRGKEILKQLGHKQILVYAPSGDTHFEKRYTSLGLAKGNDYTAYRTDI